MAGRGAAVALAAADGWPWVMHATAALCGLALLLIVAAYRPPPDATPAFATGPAKVPTVPPLRQLWPTTVAGVMWGNLNLALVLFFSFAPAAMKELGLPAVTASTWTGAALWVVMVSVPLGGLAVQRSGQPDAAIAMFCILGALALALLPLGVAPVALAICFAMALGPPAGAIVALPARVLSPEHRAGGLGVSHLLLHDPGVWPGAGRRAACTLEHRGRTPAVCRSADGCHRRFAGTVPRACSVRRLSAGHFVNPRLW